jgi:hypothetical protein
VVPWQSENPLTSGKMSSYCATLTLVLQMPSYNLSGYTKRVTGSAFVFLGYCVGNIIGPQAFLAKEAPSYPTGCKVLIACNTVQVGLIALLWLLLRTRNKKRDEAGVVDGAGTNEMLADLTDFEVSSELRSELGFDLQRVPMLTFFPKGQTIQVSVLKGAPREP